MTQNFHDLMEDLSAVLLFQHFQLSIGKRPVSYMIGSGIAVKYAVVFKILIPVVVYLLDSGQASPSVFHVNDGIVIFRRAVHPGSIET